jgi:hypothetical protein
MASSVEQFTSPGKYEIDLFFERIEDLSTRPAKIILRPNQEKKVNYQPNNQNKYIKQKNN